jgi:hypothetical protein
MNLIELIEQKEFKEADSLLGLQGTTRGPEELFDALKVALSLLMEHKKANERLNLFKIENEARVALLQKIVDGQFEAALYK